MRIAGSLAVLLLLGLAAGARSEIAAVYSGPATVIDGRTLEVGGKRFRLWGIDAPDLDQTCLTARGDRYYCGRIAKAGLIDITVGSTVECRPLAQDTDYIWFATCAAAEFDLSRGMVHSGWALADRTRTQDYVDTEYKARKAGRGLWKGRFVPPWEWRKGIRSPEDRPKSRLLEGGLPIPAQ